MTSYMDNAPEVDLEQLAKYIRTKVLIPCRFHSITSVQNPTLINT